MGALARPVPLPPWVTSRSGDGSPGPLVSPRVILLEILLFPVLDAGLFEVE
jgi:hypothetical protein